MADFLNEFPYTNFHELNASWILDKVKTASDEWASSQETIADLQSAVTELKSYLKDNLDSSAYAYMAELDADGTLLSWVQSYMTATKHQQAQISDGTLNALIKTARTYLENTASLMYMHKCKSDETNYPGVLHDYSTDPLNPDYESRGYNALMLGQSITSGEGGTTAGVTWKTTDDASIARTGKAINCSTYANLLLLGIPYQMSRYVNSNDTDNTKLQYLGGAGYCVNLWKGDIDGSNCEDFDTARLMYKAFYEADQAELIAPDYSNVSPGDVVFCGSGSAEPASAGIYHVGIVLGKTDYQARSDQTSNATPVLLITECLNQQWCIQNNMYWAHAEDNVVSFRYIYKWTHVAHPSWPEVPMEEGELVAQWSYSSNGIARQGVENVINGEVLTVEFDFDGAQTAQIRPNNRSRYDDQLTAYTKPHGIGYAHHVRGLVVADINQEAYSPDYTISDIALSSNEPIKHAIIYRGLRPGTALKHTLSASMALPAALNEVPALKFINANSRGQAKYHLEYTIPENYTITATDNSTSEAVAMAGKHCLDVDVSISQRSSSGIWVMADMDFNNSHIHCCYRAESDGPHAAVTTVTTYTA